MYLDVEKNIFKFRGIFDKFTELGSSNLKKITLYYIKYLKEW